MNNPSECPLSVDLDALLVSLRESDARAIEAILAAYDSMDLDALLASLDSDLEALLASLTAGHEKRESP
jgi:hypothetical protein